MIKELWITRKCNSYIYISIIFKLILLFKFFFWVRCINFFLLFKNSIRLSSHFESIINSSIGPVEFINPSIFPSLFICIVFFFLLPSAFTFRFFSFSFLPSLSVSSPFPFPSQYLLNILHNISWISFNRLSFSLLSVKAVLLQKFAFPCLLTFLSIHCFASVWSCSSSTGKNIPYSWSFYNLVNFFCCVEFYSQIRDIIQASESRRLVIVRTSALSLRLINLFLN